MLLHLDVVELQTAGTGCCLAVGADSVSEKHVFEAMLLGFVIGNPNTSPCLMIPPSQSQGDPDSVELDTPPEPATTDMWPAPVGTLEAEPEDTISDRLERMIIREKVRLQVLAEDQGKPDVSTLLGRVMEWIVARGVSRTELSQ